MDKPAQRHGEIREPVRRKRIDPQRLFKPGHHDRKSKRVKARVNQGKIVAELRQAAAVIPGHLHKVGYHFFSYVHVQTCLPFKTKLSGRQKNTALLRARTPIRPFGSRASLPAKVLSYQPGRFVDIPRDHWLCCAGEFLALIRVRKSPAPANAAGSSHPQRCALLDVVPLPAQLIISGLAIVP